MAATLAISAVVYTACGGGDGSSPSTAGPSSTEASGPSPTTADSPEDFVAEAADFRNIHTMTPVRGFFVDNRLGHLDEALDIARRNEGGDYPVGTIIQLVPQEAMVKRHAGWNEATRDWEFFFLDVTPQGTTIATRGADEVVNRFGGNCASCHAAAEPKFDFVCEQDHGCEPLPIGPEVISAVQEADPRPS